MKHSNYPKLLVCAYFLLSFTKIFADNPPPNIEAESGLHPSIIWAGKDALPNYRQKQICFSGTTVSIGLFGSATGGLGRGCIHYSFSRQNNHAIVWMGNHSLDENDGKLAGEKLVKKLRSHLIKPNLFHWFRNASDQKIDVVWKYDGPSHRDSSRFHKAFLKSLIKNPEFKVQGHSFIHAYHYHKKTRHYAMLARHVPVSWRYILIQPPTDQRFVSGPFYEDEPEIDARLEVYYHPKISAPAGPEDNQYTLYWENFKELEEMIRADPYDEMDTSWSVLPAQLVEYFSRFKEKDTTWLSIVIESSPAAFEACFKRSWDIALDYERCS